MNAFAGLRISILLIVASSFFSGAARANTNFLAGADFSDLAFFEARNITYKDNKQVQDGIQILKNHGINCIRLRLWTGSTAQVLTNNPYNYTNNLDYTMPLAVRVKNAGLLLALDFHYSDTWADPSHQALPLAWTNLTLAQLVQQMRIYNSNTITAFAAAGAMPDYVQVGNEITPGMLWPLGQVNAYTSGGTQWTNLCQLIAAAIQGIKDATNATGAKMPKIIIHIDRGGDWTTTMKYFDNLNAQGVPYDIIGESYYPFYHGSPASLSNCLNNAAARYGKPIIVAETAFPFTNNFPTDWTNHGASLYGYPPTPAGQVSFLATVAEIVEGLTNHLGAGIFYWGTEYQAANGVNEAGFNTASFFDAGGNVLPAASALGGTAAPLVITPSLAGTSLQLQWPFSGAASKLMTSTTLVPAVAWSVVTDSIQITGNVFTVLLPSSNNIATFYRLQSD